MKTILTLLSFIVTYSILAVTIFSLQIGYINVMILQHFDPVSRHSLNSAAETMPFVVPGCCVLQYKSGGVSFLVMSALE